MAYSTRNISYKLVDLVHSACIELEAEDGLCHATNDILAAYCSVGLMSVKAALLELVHERSIRRITTFYPVSNSRVRAIKVLRPLAGHWYTVDGRCHRAASVSEAVWLQSEHLDAVRNRGVWGSESETEEMWKEFDTGVVVPSDGEHVIGIYPNHEERLIYRLVGPKQTYAQWLDAFGHDAPGPLKWRKIEE